MNEELYLLDNNVLSHLTQAQRASAFFHERCFLPSEIVHEAEGYPDAASFKDVEYPTTANVLKHLGAVMASVSADDTALVNLYANKGAADPMLIACALDGIEEAATLLWGPTWVVVSNDNAVRAKAAEFRVESRTREEFQAWTAGEW
ncbi:MULTISPECIES: hypothetical protein [Microbacterium]|uniref:hypothetical protein n=1 Tax=Microbacterium TaxID=33882 RepID=UPI00277F9076|nr:MULTISPECIES: hypothetical protein [Microbacterium]MDQ1077276.1 hypothetical protein [Microbacterium sp. SORGH_AS_0969]MDQ1117520.1 hypothetical protein [Microbacterium testaceum]